MRGYEGDCFLEASVDSLFSLLLIGWRWFRSPGARAVNSGSSPDASWLPVTGAGTVCSTGRGPS
jgi:hypothetical protein